MRKKHSHLLALLTSGLMLTSSVSPFPLKASFSAYAASVSQGFTYEPAADGGVAITKYSGTATNLVIPDTLGGETVTEIAYGAFMNNQRLKSVEIPGCIKNIEWNAFEFCSQLESVKLNEGTERLGEQAFAWFQKLKTFTIPASVNELYLTDGSVDVFYFDTALETIYVDPENTTYKSVDGVLFSKDEKTLIRYPGAYQADEYEIPSGTLHLERNSFTNVMTTKSVIIPQSVETVDGEAFYLCESVKSLTFLNPYCELQGEHSVPFAENDGFSFNGVIFCYANSTAHKFALEHEYQYSLLSLHEFDPLIDGNSFPHSNQKTDGELGGFYGQFTYNFHDKSTYLSALCGSNPVHYAKAMILGDTIAGKWGGSCAGISSTIALQFNGILDVTKLSKIGASNYYDMEPPRMNDAFADTINFYMLQLNLTGIKDSITITSNGNPEKYDFIGGLLNSGTDSMEDMLRKIVETLENKPQAYLLSVTIPEGAHVVVPVSVEKDNLDNYVVKYFDCNYPKTMQKLTIASDYSCFSMSKPIGGTSVTQATYKYIALLDPMKYPAAVPNSAFLKTPPVIPSEQPEPDQPESEIEISFLHSADFSMNNAEGKTVDVSDLITSDAVISSVDSIGEGEGTMQVLRMPYSQSFDIVNKSDELHMTFNYNGKVMSFMVRDAKRIHVDIPTLTITFEKNAGDVSVYLPAESGEADEPELIRINGTVEGEATFSAQDGTVNVSSDKPVTDITVKSLTLTEDHVYSAVNSNDLTITAEKDGTLVSEQLCDIGDVNGDGVLSIADVEMLKEYLLGDSSVSFNNYRAADCDDNGRINAADLTLLKRILLK